MTLGTALFASVLLVLLVYHAQFRKVFFWIAGVSAVAGGLYFLGTYVYEHHKEKIRAAEQQKSIDSCVLRLTGIDPNHKPATLQTEFFDAVAACVKNPNADVFDQVAEGHGPWEKYRPQSVVEIHGGETLKIVPPHFDSSSKFDASKSIPIIYLGHNQKFVFACGNSGESQVPNKFPTIEKSMTASCP